jgi:hypothetical protein
MYSGRKITAKPHSKREKDGKSKGEAIRRRVCLRIYSVTENIYYSQLSSVALQPAAWTCFTSYNTTKGLLSLSLCAIVFRSSPPSHVSTCNGQRSSQLFCVHYTYVTTTLLSYKATNVPTCTSHCSLLRQNQHIYPPRLYRKTGHRSYVRSGR